MEIIVRGTSLKDSRGERIWFPKDGKPYYDPALGRVFKSAGEKKEYMDRNHLAMDGSTDKKKPIEAGDMRNKEYRRRMRLED